MNSPYLETLFCDDIREEVSGKMTLVGVYGPNLLVQSFPAKIPKLCLHMRLVLPEQFQFEKASFSIFKGTERIAAAEVPPQLIADRRAKGTTDVIEGLEGDKVFLVAVQMVLSGLEFDKPVPLRVRVNLDDVEIKGMGLQVAALTNLQAQELNAPPPA